MAASGDAGYYRNVIELLTVLILVLGQSGDDAAVELAKASLAEFLDDSSAPIVVRSVASRQFSMAELLCEDDGVAAGPESVSGHLIYLSAEDETYEVRVGEGVARVCGSYRSRSGARRFRAPPGQQEPTPGAPPPVDDPEAKELVRQAREDLAKQRSLELDEIELLSFERVMWPNSGLGCPKPGLSYLMVLMEGARIRLRARDVIYQYHSAEKVAPFLCEHPVGRVVPLPRR